MAFLHDRDANLMSMLAYRIAAAPNRVFEIVDLALSGPDEFKDLKPVLNAIKRALQGMDKSSVTANDIASIANILAKSPRASERMAGSFLQVALREIRGSQVVGL